MAKGNMWIPFTVLFAFYFSVSVAAGHDGLLFVETFDGKDPFESGKWVKSTDAKYLDQPVMVKPANAPGKGFEKDKGLQLTQEMKYYGFGAKFDSPIDMKNKNELVIQYELKLEETLACGGAYVKLPRASPDFDITSFNSDTPYTIMFGPDKCGTANNKVHFILQHENPLNHSWTEKHFNNTPAVKMDKKTHLYTLAIRSDNSFEMYIDQKSIRSGNLLTHMIPPINPPETIDDVEDKKPADWVEEATMEDPHAVKPDDWDEDAPRMIPNPKAVKPAEWLDNAPLEIADPTAKKPEDWDDEEDGTWEAPLIANPACEVAGCGEWRAPVIKNPDFKGRWKTPLIDNPFYKGVWKPRQVPNPDYYSDTTPALTLAPMAGLVVEVWTISAGIHFDNFLIADSLTAAFDYADATFKLKNEAEVKLDKKEKKESAKKNREDMIKSGTLLEQFEAYFAGVMETVVDFYGDQPWTIAVTLVALVAAFFMMLPKNSKKQKKPIKTQTETETETENTEEEKKAESEENENKDE